MPTFLKRLELGEGEKAEGKRKGRGERYFEGGTLCNPTYGGDGFANGHSEPLGRV